MRKSGRHIWDIWGNIGPFWVIFGPFRIILGHSRAMLGHFGSYLGHLGPFWVIFGHFWAILWHFWTNLRKVQFFCGILNPAILAFRMYDRALIRPPWVSLRNEGMWSWSSWRPRWAVFTRIPTPHHLHSWETLHHRKPSRSHHLCSHQSLMCEY